jgi:hypothetical protein
MVFTAPIFSKSCLLNIITGLHLLENSTQVGVQSTDTIIRKIVYVTGQTVVVAAEEGVDSLPGECLLIS